MGSSSSKFVNKTGILDVPLPEILAGVDINKLKRKPSQILRDERQRLDELQKSISQNTKEVNKISKNIDSIKTEVQQEEITNSLNKQNELNRYKYSLIDTKPVTAPLLDTNIDAFTINPKTKLPSMMVENDKIGSKLIEIPSNSSDKEMKRSPLDRYSYTEIELPKNPGLIKDNNLGNNIINPKTKRPSLMISDNKIDRDIIKVPSNESEAEMKKSSIDKYSYQPMEMKGGNGIMINGISFSKGLISLNQNKENNKQMLQNIPISKGLIKPKFNKHYSSKLVKYKDHLIAM